jgi:AmpE protein
MAITLIAVVVALALGHAAPAFARSVREYGWFGNWLRWLDGKLPGEGVWRGRWGVVVALLPPLLLVLLFQLALDDALFGFAALVFAIGVLFYAWGPRDLDLDVDAVLSAGDPATRRAAAVRLGAASTDAPSLVDAVFRGAQRRWFGVLFWFLLLGPFGALLYRLAALAAEAGNDGALAPEAASGARWLHALLDWPVAQLMTLAMALVGSFDTVVGAWKDHGGAGFDPDAGFLTAAGRASVRAEVAEEVRDYVEEGVTGTGIAVQMGEMPELRDAMGLAWRILLAWLAVLALFVLAGWVA